jgi:hypothetical protein
MEVGDVGNDANGKRFHCANVKAQSPDTMCRAIAEARRRLTNIVEF